MATFRSKRTREDTYAARLRRARDEGDAFGVREASLCRAACSGRQWDRQDALDWLNAAIQTDRVELEAQHALEHELELWDRACRIAFLVTVVSYERKKP